jgi:hypothetical protein
LPRWFARIVRDWHRRKARRLTELAEKQRKELDQLIERAAHHVHRAKHWDVYNRHVR